MWLLCRISAPLNRPILDISFLAALIFQLSWNVNCKWALGETKALRRKSFEIQYYGEAQAQTVRKQTSARSPQTSKRLASTSRADRGYNYDDAYTPRL